MAKRQHVLLTTSRRPTESLRTLCRDISYNLPNVVRVNRGKLSLEETAEKALKLNAEKVIIFDRWDRGLGRIEFFEIAHDGLKNVPPVVYVLNAKFRREFEKQMLRKSEFAAIVASSKGNFETRKLEDAFSSFFTIPILPLEEAVNNKCDIIMQLQSDSSNRLAITFRHVPELLEVGPQIKISHAVWELT